MNILYVCTPSSIHDQNWINFFAEKQNFNVYVLGESKQEFHWQNASHVKKIKLLPPLFPFSITKPLHILLSILRLRKYCRDYNIDMVHILFATPYALWANFISIPYIITTRGSDVLLVLPQLKEQKGIRKFYYSWLYKMFKKAFENAAFITCTSEQQKRKIAEMFSLDSQVIRTGVDVEKINSIDAAMFLPKQLMGKKYIFSPRFMSPIYNIGYQIEAMALLSKSITDTYSFVFVKGKNFDEVYFKKQIDALNKLIHVNYMIFDFLSQEELWATFKMASLAIMTPISDGTPNSALEAMAAKCPLIISDLPYDKALFENTCEKVPLNDPYLLAKKIEEILNDRGNKTDNAAEAVKLFGNRKTEMEKLEVLYSKIIQSKAQNNSTTFFNERL